MTWAEISSAAVFNVPAWAGGVPGVLNIDMDHTAMYTNDSSVFQITTKVLGGSTFHGIGAKVPGHYLAKTEVDISNGDTAGIVEISWSSTPGHEAFYGSAGFNFLPIGVGPRGSNQTMPYMETLVTCAAITYPTDPFIIQVSNFSGAILQVSTVDMIVVQMDTDQTLIG
jgi:hypothetical protein